MSSITTVTILPVFDKPVGRILEHLNALADAHPRAAAFEVLTATEQPFLDRMQVIAGKVNHCDEDTLRQAVRAGAQDPNWGSYFFALTVLLSDEDDRSDGTPPRALRLDNDGNWH